MLKKILPFLLFFAVIFLSTPKPTYAFSFSEVLNGVKNFFSQKPAEKKEFTLDSNITLAPDGDVNGNSQIDSGDTVQFTYTITNTTDIAYKFATLKTNIKRDQLNFIHNVTGATGVTETNNTVDFPNILLSANEKKVVSFEARLNFSEEDSILSTEPEFVTLDKKSVTKSSKKEILSKKLNKDEIKNRVEKMGISRSLPTQP